MRVVVLDLQDGDAEFGCDGGRVVFRVQVAADELRLHFEQFGHPRDRFAQGADRAQVLHVADVGRGIEEAAVCEAERVFEFAADAERLSAEVAGDEERERRVAARTPDHVRTAVQPVHDRIVRAETDPAVVRQDHVAECGDLGEGVLVAATDGRAGDVAAGHHEAVRHGQVVVEAEEQHLDGRVRQHHAERGIAGRKDVRERAFGALPEQDDRFLMPVQDLLLTGQDHAFAADRLERIHHHGERLHGTALEFAQSRHRLRVAGVAAQMESADALDSDDLPLEDRAAGGGDGFPVAFGAADEVDLRTAVVTADRLGVVAARFRRGVFGLALRTHREIAHAGAFAVVWHGVEDGQARSARGAVDEGVQITAVRGVEQLRFALVARGDVRRDEDVARLVFALDDLERRIRRLRAGARIDLQDRGPGRGLAFERGAEVVHRSGIALRVDLHVGPLVRDASGQPGADGDPADERPEPDALDDAVNAEDRGGNARRIHVIAPLREAARRRRNAGSRRCGTAESGAGRRADVCRRRSRRSRRSRPLR